MKCCIIAIGTSASSNLAVSIRACKASVKHNLLQALAILTLEIADKRVISLAVRESVFFESVIHRGAKVAIIFITFALVITKPLNTYLL